MEFKFNINELFKTPIVEITNNLVPPGFHGDRRQLWDSVTKVSEVVNTIGEASAAAQGLTKPITTSDRLRNAENQKLYLLIDRDSKTGKGCVTGMLKTGKKGLYVFDREGQHYQVQPNCVLDFYIHESRQRTGLGKHLFEHMLKKEEVEPVKLAIDRPSDKFLAFLKKHYSLEAAIRQMNNYVVFEGFFPENDKEKLISQHSSNNNTETPTNRMTTTIPLNKRGSNGLQQQITSPYGRYGAPRPPCSMGQIIHNQSAVVGPQEPSGCSLNMKPRNERSALTLPRAPRLMTDEERKLAYAPPRVPFVPCPSVGNGLGAANYSNSKSAVNFQPTLAESNIKLVSKQQMTMAAQQSSAKAGRPQSLLQNLPSPSKSIVDSNYSPRGLPTIPENINISQTALLHQNQNVVNCPSVSKQFSPLPTTYQQIPQQNNHQNHQQMGQQNRQPQMIPQIYQQPYSEAQSNLTNSQAYVNPALAQTVQNQYINPSAFVQPTDDRVTRPKPLITDPLKEYNNNIITTTSVTNQNQQLQYAQVPVTNTRQTTPVSPSSQRMYWQNQVYQSRDAPTNYPFTDSPDNPNKAYISLEECTECIKQQQEALSMVKGQQLERTKQEQEVAQTMVRQDLNGPYVNYKDVTIPNAYSSVVTVDPTDTPEQNMMNHQQSGQQQTVTYQVPLDHQQQMHQAEQIQNVNQGYQHQTQNPQVVQQDLDSTSHPLGGRKASLCQAHQEIADRQAQQTNAHVLSKTVSKQVLPMDSVDQNTEALQQVATIQNNSNTGTHPNVLSKFNSNMPQNVTQVNDVPHNTEQAPPIQGSEHYKNRQNNDPRYHVPEDLQAVPVSPRYNEMSSPTTVLNVSSFHQQSPRLNQYMTQNSQAQNQNYNYQGVDYSQQYLPQQSQQGAVPANAQIMGNSAAAMQNQGNLQQQSSRLNKTNTNQEDSLRVATESPHPNYHASATRLLAASANPQVNPQYPNQSIYAQNQNPYPAVDNTLDTNQTNSGIPKSPRSANVSPTRFAYSLNNPIQTSPINHMEYNYAPIESSEQDIHTPVAKLENIIKNSHKLEKAFPSLQNSDQTKTNLQPLSLANADSGKVSAATQITTRSIPKGPTHQAPKSTSSPDSYRNMPQQEAYKNMYPPPGHQLNMLKERDSRHDQYEANKRRSYNHTPPAMNGDMQESLQPRPAAMRPEITSQ